MVDAENLAFLIEAGFSESAAKKALETNNNSTAEAMEWLLIHGEDAIGETIPQANTLKLSTVAATDDETEKANVDDAATSATANSLKCEDCGILLKDEDVATLHVRKKKISFIFSIFKKISKYNY